VQGCWNGFLHSSLAQKGQYGAILFPDNPFPSARGEIAKGALTGIDVNDLVQLLPEVDTVPVHLLAEC
jgi:hypothetical protein